MPLLRALIPLLAAALAAPAVASGARTSIFYYPWFGTPARDGAYLHWQQNGRQPPHDIASNFLPARGFYSSGDPKVVRAQMREIAAAGIDVVVTSWWGRGSTEDLRLPLVLARARAAGVAVAAHVEPYPGRTPATLVNDVTYLRGLGIREVYVYRTVDFTAEQWRAATDAVTGVRVYGHTGHVGFAAAARFDGVYTYDVLLYGGAFFARYCAQAHKVGLQCLPSVGPGYAASRATGDRRTKPRRRGRTYDAMWRSALRAGADGLTITSYNEWSEGTQIEPARSLPGSGYLSYDGAYGLRGRPARLAYLVRTACWTDVFSRWLVGDPAVC